jgi:hypothetical protein
LTAIMAKSMSSLAVSPRYWGKTRLFQRYAAWAGPLVRMCACAHLTKIIHLQDDLWETGNIVNASKSTIHVSHSLLCLREADRSGLSRGEQ